MKKINFLFAAVAAVLSISCNKDIKMVVSGSEMANAPISFKISGMDVDISTKVDAVTSLESFNVIASTGSAGAESMNWSTVATRSGDSYITNRYWPYSDPGYHFYASNTAMTFNAAGPVVGVDGTVDVVCAHSNNPVFNVPTILNFHHVMSRLGSVTVNHTTGYSLTGLSITLNNVRTTGTYNIRTNAWTDMNLVQTQSVQEGANDLYVVPGQYNLSVGFTLVKGDYSGTFSGNANIDFTVEKVCNITIDITKDPAVAISFGVSMTPWEPKEVSLTLS